jgi:hypothetical protein
MRKPLAVGTLLAAVILTFSSTWAGVLDAPWREQQLNFVFRNATRSNQTRDSSAVQSKASYATTSLVDTTESIDMRGAHFRSAHGWNPPLVLPANAAAGRWSIIDTLYAFSIRFGSPNGAATGFDSAFVAVQGSPDNQTWTNLDTLGLGAVVTSTPALGSVPFLISATTGQGTADFYTTLRNVGTQRFNWDRPNVNFLRFICREDPNATAGTVYEFWISSKRLETMAPPTGSGYR